MSSSGIAYTRMGAGEPLLLIHGIGSDRRAWHGAVMDVAQHREIVAVDLPGFGLSPLGDITVSVDGYADQLLRLLTELGIESPHMAGDSFGGAIALELGRRGVARSVVAFAPIGFWGASGAVWAQCALRRSHAASRTLRRVLPALAVTPVGRFAAAALFYGRPKALAPQQVIDDAEVFRTGLGFDPVCDSFGDYVFTDAGRLADIPVTIVWGSRDRLLPAWSQAGRARAALPRARHLRLAGIGHACVSEDPASCRLLVLDRWS